MAAMAPTFGQSHAKSEEDLRKELEELELQQEQINERLREASVRRSVRPAGRGGTLGPGPGLGGLERPGGLPAHGVQKLASCGPGGLQRGLVRSAEELNGGDPEQPARKKRLLSAVVKVSSAAPGEDLGGGSAETGKREREPAGTGGRLRFGDHQQDGPRSLETAGGGGGGEGEPASKALPRVLPVEKDAGAVRRNRRMFGALLLGTLEKFKEEDKKLQGSEAYMRRTHSLQRAEQRKVEESERLRQQERQEEEERRRRDLTLRARLSAKAEEKQLELLLLQWSRHRTRLASFLRTRTQPSIYFQPAHPCAEAEPWTGADMQTAFETWWEGRRAEVHEYCKARQDECLRAVDQEMARGQRREQARGPQGAPGAPEPARDGPGSGQEGRPSTSTTGELGRHEGHEAPEANDDLAQEEGSRVAREGPVEGVEAPGVSEEAT